MGGRDQHQPGVLAPLTHACWVLTGLSGSGAALRGYRRSFFSVKGLVVALLGDH